MPCLQFSGRHLAGYVNQSEVCENLYLPNGVLKVVSTELSLLSFIIQKPDRQSKRLKYFAVVSLAVTSSSVFDL